MCSFEKLNNPTSKHKFLLRTQHASPQNTRNFLIFLSRLENFPPKSMKTPNFGANYFLNGALPDCCFINLRQAQEVGRFWEANIETAFQGAHRQAARKSFLPPLARTTAFTCWCLHPFRIGDTFACFKRIGEKAQKKNGKKSATDKAVRAKKKRKNFAPLPSFVPFGAAA